MKRYSMFIDGEWVNPSSGLWLDSVNPYSGEKWAEIPLGNSEDVDRAVQAAERAMRQGAWSRMTPSQRGQALVRFADVLLEHAPRLAEIEVRDNGKLYAEMSNQCKYLVEWFRYAAH